MTNRCDKVRCLERIVRDNDIGKGLGLTHKWNRNGVRMAALKCVAAHGGDEAIKSLRRITKDLHLNGELKVCASKFLEMLRHDGGNREVEKASVQKFIQT